MKKNNRIQWHDLRKNPKDLPEEEGNYLWVLRDKDTKQKFCEILTYSKRYTDEDEWYINSMLWTLKDAVKWCEIPPYDDKEYTDE